MSVEAHQYKKAIYNLKYNFKLLELDLMNLDCHSGLKWKNGAIKNIVLPRDHPVSSKSMLCCNSVARFGGFGANF